MSPELEDALAIVRAAGYRPVHRSDAVAHAATCRRCERWAREVQEYRESRYTWEQQRDAECHGYATEEAQYAIDHPPPTFRRWLEGLRTEDERMTDRPETIPPFDALTFDGATYDPQQDRGRLARQQRAVFDVLREHGHDWTTLEYVAERVGASEASVSARLRDLRKPRNGGHLVDRRRVEGGLYAYRLVPRAEQAEREREAAQAVQDDARATAYAP